MGYRKKRIIMVLVLFFTGFSLWKVKGEAEDNADLGNVELVVLLDTSESMNRGEIWEKAKIWAEDIGAFSLETDIFLRVICFDGKGFDGTGEECPNIRKVFMGKVNDGEELVSYGDKVEQVHAEGEYTDHRGALKYVQNILKDSASSCQCIMILSDGDLDYDDEKGHSETEECAIKEFGELAKSFAEEDNQSVILVGFGSGKNLFQNIAKGTNIVYFDGDKEGMDAIRSIFQELSYPIELVDNYGSENEIKFDVTPDCYRIIINIRAYEQTSEELNKDKIIVSGPEGWNEDSYSYSPLQNSSYLYLNNIMGGEYSVILPAGHWKSSIICQRLALSDDILFKILQNGQEIMRDIDTDSYNISGTSFEIEIVGQNLNYIEPYYLCYLEEGEVSSEKQRLLISDYSSNKSTIELEEQDKNYIFQIVCKEGDKESKSAPIRITTSSVDVEVIERPMEDINTYEKIELANYFEKWSNCQLCINGESANTAALECEFDNDVLAYSGKNGYTLVFKKAGKYHLIVTDKETGQKYFDQVYNVSKRSLFKTICDWLRALRGDS